MILDVYHFQTFSAPTYEANYSMTNVVSRLIQQSLFMASPSSLQYAVNTALRNPLPQAVCEASASRKALTGPPTTVTPPLWRRRRHPFPRPLARLASRETRRLDRGYSPRTQIDHHLRNSWPRRPLFRCCNPPQTLSRRKVCRHARDSRGHEERRRADSTFVGPLVSW